MKKIVCLLILVSSIVSFQASAGKGTKRGLESVTSTGSSSPSLPDSAEDDEIKHKSKRARAEKKSPEEIYQNLKKNFDDTVFDLFQNGLNAEQENNSEEAIQNFKSFLEAASHVELNECTKKAVQYLFENVV